MGINNDHVIDQILNYFQVHLQRCLKDLQEEYAKCSVTVSEPIGSTFFLPLRHLKSSLSAFPGDDSETA